MIYSASKNWNRILIIKRTRARIRGSWFNEIVLAMLWTGSSASPLMGPGSHFWYSLYILGVLPADTAESLPRIVFGWREFMPPPWGQPMFSDLSVHQVSPPCLDLRHLVRTIPAAKLPLGLAKALDTPASPSVLLPFLITGDGLKNSPQEIFCTHIST